MARASRKREKTCDRCGEQRDVMYRCLVTDEEGWIFCCEPCLLKEKTRHPQSYRYGGTWKAHKR